MKINAMDVAEGSPAYESGLQEGDKFLKVNGLKFLHRMIFLQEYYYHMEIQ